MNFDSNYENEVDKTEVEKLLDELDVILDPESAKIDTMSDTAIHGYLTAVACAKIEIPLERWLPGIFGEGKEMPQLSSSSLTSAVTDVLERIKSAIRAELEHGDYVAVVDIDEQNGDLVEDVADWCRGFFIGIEDHYAEAIENNDALWEFIEPIVYLSDPEEIEKELPESDVAELREQKSNFIDEIEECVFDFYEFWNGPLVPSVVDAFSAPDDGPDRNAPCPCGSGKKYKRCCGRNL